VTGLYIGKIFTQVKDRPLYLVDEVVDGVTPNSLLRELIEPDVDHGSGSATTQAKRLV
jgi:hypothetical protein